MPATNRDQLYQKTFATQNCTVAQVDKFTRGFPGTSKVLLEGFLACFFFRVASSTTSVSLRLSSIAEERADALRDGSSRNGFFAATRSAPYTTGADEPSPQATA